MKYRSFLWCVLIYFSLFGAEQEVEISFLAGKTISMDRVFMEQYSGTFKYFLEDMTSDSSNTFKCDKFTDTAFLQWCSYIEEPSREAQIKRLQEASLGTIIELVLIANFLVSEPLLDAALTVLAGKLTEQQELEKFYKNKRRYLSILRQMGIDHNLEHSLFKKLKNQALQEGILFQSVEPTKEPTQLEELLMLYKPKKRTFLSMKPGLAYAALFTYGLGLVLATYLEWGTNSNCSN